MKTEEDAFEWDGDDEERFAMEKVHGLNDDFDDGDRAKFNGMDEENGFEDADWRTLATSQVVQETEQSAPREGGLDIAGLLPTEVKQEAVGSAQSIPKPSSTHSIGEIRVPCDGGSPSGIKIMRFTRKRTSTPRTRRKDVGAALRKFTEEASEVGTSQQKTVVKLEAEAPAAAQASAVQKRIASPAKTEVKIEGRAEVKRENETSKEKTLETRCVLVKARSIDDLMDTAAKKPPQGALDGKRPRPKMQGVAEQQQQNKKPKALAFQKSRNIINKRINAETPVKPEPVVNINCADVVTMQEKHSSVLGELRGVVEEIKSRTPADEEALKETPAALQGRWLDTRCKLLGIKFDMHFSVVSHFLCHQHEIEAPISQF